MSSWTSIAKPTSSVWTSSNPQGKEQYDQATITYDSATTFYDGYNPSQWTDIPKPSITSFTTTPGMATGLVMSPTYATAINITNDPWTKVSKPT